MKLFAKIVNGSQRLQTVYNLKSGRPSRKSKDIFIFRGKLKFALRGRGGRQQCVLTRQSGSKHICSYLTYCISLGWIILQTSEFIFLLKCFQGGKFKLSTTSRRMENFKKQIVRARSKIFYFQSKVKICIKGKGKRVAANSVCWQGSLLWYIFAAISHIQIIRLNKVVLYLR